MGKIQAGITSEAGHKRKWHETGRRVSKKGRTAEKTK